MLKILNGYCVLSSDIGCLTFKYRQYVPAQLYFEGSDWSNSCNALFLALCRHLIPQIDLLRIITWLACLIMFPEFLLGSSEIHLFWDYGQESVC